MRNTSHLSLLPQTIAQTPTHFGINLEVQDHAGELNLWDWLADSGASVARELHPARFLRPEGYSDPAWETISDKKSFELWRAEIREKPEIHVPREAIQLGQSVPWMGTPNHFLAKLTQCAIQPIISIDFNLRSCGEALIKELESPDWDKDEQLNWPVAANAYAYSFALAYYTAKDHGARLFSMMNEPENRFGWFFLPGDMEQRLGDSPWFTISEGEDRALTERYFRIVARQFALLSKLTRLALDDVSACLQIEPIRLLGPTNVVWKTLWNFAKPWLDSCDVHHYSPDASSFRALYAGIRAEAGSKSFSLTEFNRFSGPVPIEESTLNPRASLRLAEVLMEVLQLGRPDNPCEIATLYLLNAPSTHRNHKHLLYGDLNFLDWSGKDNAPWSRSEAWYPACAELQVRHPTLAFVIFRMLARACRPHPWSGDTHGPYPVKEWALHNPTSADPNAITSQLRCLVVQQSHATFIQILNPGKQSVKDLTIELGDNAFASAFIRRTQVELLDETVHRATLARSECIVDLPPESFSQIILTKVEIPADSSIELREQTHTPGQLSNLKLWQTTRLRAIAQTSRKPIDITDLCAQFHCSDDCFRVTNSGLVQRIRESSAPPKLGVSLPENPQPCF